MLYSRIYADYLGFLDIILLLMRKPLTQWFMTVSTSEVLVSIMNLLITTDLLLADDYIFFTSFTILTCGAGTVYSSRAFEFTPIL